MGIKWKIPLKFRRGGDEYRRDELYQELISVQFMLNKLFSAKEMIHFNRLYPTLDEFDKEEKLLDDALNHWRGLEVGIHEIIKYYDELKRGEDG